MDRRIELLKKCDSTFFTVKRSYLRSKGESGYLLYRVLRPILKVRYSFFRKFKHIGGERRDAERAASYS